jgi:hypothetical protein
MILARHVQTFSLSLGERAGVRASFVSNCIVPVGERAGVRGNFGRPRHLLVYSVAEVL